MAKEDVDSRKTLKHTKKKRKRKIILFSILVPLLLLVAVTSVYAYDLFTTAQKVADDSYEDDGREKSELRAQEVDPGKDHVSILFVGIDNSEHRDNEGNALSDALILATLNKNDNSIKMLSIPRDSYVQIPEVGYQDKITHAHAFGGVNATIESVETMMDVPVDYYVRLNFNAFVDAINALGGITAEVPYEFSESNSDDEKNSIHLYPGEQELNGEEALALARTRKLDNDIERGKRQQDILQAIIQKGTSVNGLLKLDEMLEAVGDNMTTNMTFDEMKSLVSYGTSGSFDIETFTLDGSDLMLEGIYYYQLNEADLAEKKQTLQEHLELDEEENGQESNVDESIQSNDEANTEQTD
ncbi:transcriptional regulator [Gracilibacillus halophilus YIM-C55.5]|uniref:Transcriptional regulator n=1 Tax=Gracilibacillus halophilus YIM-C55.5 TaxID=1308866 RepID=N4WUT8_9BACI|nr:LCP family protein [Gracilibacillus halophilus]ENH98085.1 transcriptional regulator [Gracilibacillus halophilus YIM-C55.5]